MVRKTGIEPVLKPYKGLYSATKLLAYYVK